MKSFITRLVSAVIAVLAVIFSYKYWDTQGLKLLTVIAVVLGGRELMQILFRPEESKTVRSAFYVTVMVIYSVSTLHPSYAGLCFAVSCILFCLISLVIQKKFQDLQQLSQTQAKSIMGFFYVGLLPSFAAQILDLQAGAQWFFTLLCIVFAGDILAYIVGSQWGKHKIIPAVSPKKSVEGSLGGLVGSLIAGLICMQFLPEMSVLKMLTLSFATAVVAQFGDFFESLLKRVADIKDSGSIMPGHGGILDRIDGVLFASPIILMGATLLEKI